MKTVQEYEAKRGKRKFNYRCGKWNLRGIQVDTRDIFVLSAPK